MLSKILRKKFPLVLVFILIFSLIINPAIGGIDSMYAAENQLVKNGDFETGDLSYWYIGESNKFEVSNEESNSGQYSIKVTSEEQIWDSLAQTLQVEADTDYTLTFYGKGEGDALYKVMTSDWAKTIEERTTTNQSSNWTQYDLSFNSGPNTEVVIYISDSAGNAYYDDFSMVPSTNKNDESTGGSIFKYGDFESADLTGWDFGESAKFSVTDEESYAGEYSLKISSTEQIWDAIKSSVNVEPGRNYQLTFYSKGKGEAIYKVLGEGNSTIAEGKTNNDEGEWTAYTLNFNSESYSKVNLYISDTTANAYFDEFEISLIPSVPLNGDFELGDLTYWDTDSSKFSVTSDFFNSGQYSLKITSSNQDWDSLTQKVSVKPDTDYTLSFKGKGDGNSHIKVMTSDWSSDLIGKNTANNPDSWEEYKLNFNSGEESEVVIFISDSLSDAYYDNFLLDLYRVEPREETDPINDRDAVSTDGFNLNPVELVNPNVTDETKSLYVYLKNISNDYLLFGHHNTTSQRLVSNAPGGSDVYGAVGAYPAVFGWDFVDVVAEPGGLDTLIERTKEAYANNGIITLSDHMPNFSVENGYYDDIYPTVEHILPGGKDHDKFLERLDMTAEYAKRSVDQNNKPIPIIYRPFHENSGLWFWWGVSNTTKSEYINLWRFTVEYLRDVKKVDNMLFAYSPNGHFIDELDYLSRYPGDDYVDILGFDVYHDNPQYDDGWIEATLKDAQIITTIAESKDKIAALTETGLRWNGQDGLKDSGNTMPDWYMVLHDTLMSDPSAKKLAYMLVWRNGNESHYWVPFRDHPTRGNHEMLYDFVHFYNQDTMVFADRLSGVYDFNVDPIPKEPQGYIAAPGEREKVKDTIKFKAKAIGFGKNVEKVEFFLNDQKMSDDAVFEDEYYVLEWDSTEVEDGNHNLNTIIYFEDETIIEDSVDFIVLNSDTELTDPAIVDDFEDYNGDVSILRETFLRNTNGDINIVSLIDSPFSDGTAMKFEYNLGSVGYTGVSKTLYADWSDGEALGLWFKGDGKEQDILLQLGSSGSYEVHLNDHKNFDPQSTEPQYLKIPFNEFKSKDGSSKSLNLGNIQTFAIYVNAIDGAKISNSVLIFDEIKMLTSMTEPGDGDGDGDQEPGDGDGDGDQEPGDGDGDGDQKPGDGDGDGDQEPGDGDGDGDQEPSDGDDDGDQEPSDDDESKDKVVTPGEKVKVNSGETIRIKGTDAVITMPSDLPVGTEIKVDILTTDNLSDTGNMVFTGEGLDVTMYFPSGYEDYTGNFILTLKYDNGIYAKDQVDIYYYNEDKATWEKQNGEVDEENGVIKLEVLHLSVYAVLADIGSDNGSGDDSGVSIEDGEGDKGSDNELPKTATNVYNLLLIGFIMIFISGVFIYISKKRRLNV